MAGIASPLFYVALNIGEAGIIKDLFVIIRETGAFHRRGDPALPQFSYRKIQITLLHG
jgi:hypothetical protein